jgi:hypothetical protein
MPGLLRLVLASAVLGLVLAAGAQADHLDPQERFTPADQARARTMLLKRADIAAGATSHPAGAPAHATCRALGESDLVITGQARSKEFRVAGLLSFQSVAQVYRSGREAAASWTRGTSSAGAACLKVEFRKLAGGLQFESFRRLIFPRVAQRTQAYRATFSGRSQGQTIRVYVDAIYLGYARAMSGIFIASPFAAPQQKAEVRLARVVTGRMTKAMRGA